MMNSDKLLLYEGKSRLSFVVQLHPGCMYHIVYKSHLRCQTRVVQLGLLRLEALSILRVEYFHMASPWYIDCQSPIKVSLSSDVCNDNQIILRGWPLVRGLIYWQRFTAVEAEPAIHPT